MQNQIWKKKLRINKCFADERNPADYNRWIYIHTIGVAVKRNLIILPVFPTDLLRSHLLKQTKNKTINLDQRDLIQESS